MRTGSKMRHIWNAAKRCSWIHSRLEINRRENGFVRLQKDSRGDLPGRLNFAGDAKSPCWPTPAETPGETPTEDVPVLPPDAWEPGGGQQCQDISPCHGTILKVGRWGPVQKREQVPIPEAVGSGTQTHDSGSQPLASS